VAKNSAEQKMNRAQWMLIKNHTLGKRNVFPVEKLCKKE
jgi:hypothetical protein